MELLKEILDREGCSLVIRSQGKEQCYWKRGVADLLFLLHNEPDELHQAQLADKVIGKGAAALMVLGGVIEVYAHVISQPALQLLEDAGVSVSYSQCVEHIINRAGTDWCPVEKLCRSAATAEECLPLIEQFLSGKL
ncbi:MAG: DUF1893 domain-containing protein [Bacteroidaceae bacterium]|nr:DUF1893 domain-containing protein [Bacteroidaceae bacterium]